MHLVMVATAKRCQIVGAEKQCFVAVGYLDMMYFVCRVVAEPAYRVSFHERTAQLVPSRGTSQRIVACSVLWTAFAVISRRTVVMPRLSGILLILRLLWF
jgi:hypothetical protein